MSQNKKGSLLGLDWRLKALGMFILTITAAAMLTTPSVAEQKRIAGIDDAQRQLVADLFSKNCTRTTDVSGLYVEPVQHFSGKHYTTRYEPRDFYGWTCSNGVVYWGLKNTIPAGFLADYKNLPVAGDLPKAADVPAN